TRRIDVTAGARGESELRGVFSRTLLLVASMLAVVLVALGVNLAGLLAVRAMDQRRQVAVRAALGASRWRIASAWLGESLFLVLAGAALGVGLAIRGGSLLLRWLPQPGLDAAFTIRPDGRVVLLVVLVALATALLVGGLAAWESARVQPAMRLREEGG